MKLILHVKSIKANKKLLKDGNKLDDKENQFLRELAMLKYKKNQQVE
jgi:hypothetical protein